MIKSTNKLYYQDSFLSECEAVVIDISEKGIVLDKTISFPEGGGQEGDHGIILIEEGNREILFLDTQKGLGRTLLLNDFPTIQVDAPIYHLVDAVNLNYFKIGMRVSIKIDIERRAKITISHTGIHLVLMGIDKIRPGMSKNVKGCHIDTLHARLDFHTEEKFSTFEIEEIIDFVNKIVDKDESICVFPHSKEPEAWYWKCMDVVYPCGGTHLPSTMYVGHINLKRRSMGKKLERIIAEYPNTYLPKDLYHI